MTREKKREGREKNGKGPEDIMSWGLRGGGGEAKQKISPLFDFSSFIPFLLLYIKLRRGKIERKKMENDFFFLRAYIYVSHRQNRFYIWHGE